MRAPWRWACSTIPAAPPPRRSARQSIGSVRPNTFMWPERRDLAAPDRDDPVPPWVELAMVADGVVIRDGDEVEAALGGASQAFVDREQPVAVDRVRVQVAAVPPDSGGPGRRD